MTSISRGWVAPDRMPRDQFDPGRDGPDPASLGLWTSRRLAAAGPGRGRVNDASVGVAGLADARADAGRNSRGTER